MAEKVNGEKRDNRKNNADKNAFQKIAGAFARMGRGLKTFFINLKAELKRVIWPDKKRLIQSTATVLAICLLAAILLFVVDSVLSGILNGIGFYTPAADRPAVTETVADTNEGA